MSITGNRRIGARTHPKKRLRPNRRTQQMHINSLMAYYDNIHKFSRREKEVLGCLVMYNNVPMTDRRIKEMLRYADMNAVRPRISDLIDKEVLQECGNVTDHITKKQVRTVRFVMKGTMQETFNFNKGAV
jgi:uncharacterized protein YciW